MIFAVIMGIGLMILKDRYVGEEKQYLPRILFITFMMMLLVNIVGSRGIYKYYFVAIVPFFSIFSSARMIRGTGEHVPFSLSMVLIPIPLSLLILLPDRNYYMLYLILIFALYCLAPILDRSYDLMKRGVRKMTDRLPVSFEQLSLKSPLETRASKVMSWISLVLSLVIGLSLIVFGFWFSLQIVGANPILILLVLLVVGIALTLAPQMISLFLSSSDASTFNENLISFSYVTAAVLFVFSIGTYIQAWNVMEFSVRLPLILSAIFVAIWACSLVIKIGIYERLVADVFLLVGTSVGLLLWQSVNDLILQTIGLLSICTLLIHLLLVITLLLHSRGTSATPEVLETTSQVH